jgi:hypothetical protein
MAGRMDKREKGRNDVAVKAKTVCWNVRGKE